MVRAMPVPKLISGRNPIVSAARRKKVELPAKAITLLDGYFDGLLAEIIQAMA